MIDKACLNDILAKYKENLTTNKDWWKGEKYKWEAVQCFQKNWDVNAEDFYEMLCRSLAKTANLLASRNNFPRDRIERFAKVVPEEVRAMFVSLYDESRDAYERIKEFKEKSAVLIKKYGNDFDNHYQKENAITVYLWLRYPDKYYIYKSGVVKAVATELKSDYRFKNGAYSDNIHNFLQLYNEITQELKQDLELIELLKSHLTDTCYPDSELKTLTVDFGFYISVLKKSSHDEEIETGTPKSNAAFLRWFKPLLQALRDLGGEATPPVARRKIIENEHLTEEEVSEKRGRNNVNKFENEVAFARSYLVYGGYIDKSTNGVWKLTEAGMTADMTDELAAKIFKDGVAAMRQKRTEETDNIENEEPEVPHYTPYTESDFLNEVYMPKEKYEIITNLLSVKKNIILQGAPGVGKTFAAKRLAWAVMGETDDDRIEFVQFHQNYSYEDFVMGYKPVKESFELKEGVFYRFCKKAEQQPDKKFFFIIDEINRGNMSKIFGELLMLIENDYRGTPITLPYREEQFSVPKNLYIIGMMNTADRSLAMIDYALRRRFSFIDMEPAFDSEGFKAYQQRLQNETLDNLVEKIKKLNKEIAGDKSLGKGFCIGHSYFCKFDNENCTVENLCAIVNYDIIPTLSEYWFDDEDKLEHWETELHGVVQ